MALGMNRNPSDDPAGRPVVLAVIGAAHGIRGEVRVRSFTGEPLAFAGYGPLTGSDGRTYRVLSARMGAGGPIARLAGIEERTAAESLRGIELSVPRSALDPVESDSDEFYYADLIGLRAIDAAGTDHGRVIAVHDFGGGAMLELRRDGEPSRMIPFTRSAVPTVEIGAGRILVDPAAAGLLDMQEEKEEE